MKSPVLMLALAAALSAPIAAVAAGHDETSKAAFAATTLNLTAFGEARIAPDMATINIGVQTEAPTAQEAMRLNAERMNQVTAALRRQGIAARDIQTSGLNLNPQTVYAENTPPRVTGYQASNQVTVTVNDLARLGQAVDAVVAAGSNTINGVSFGLKAPAVAENAARQDAVRAVQARAALYAQAAGHRVRRLVNLSEVSSFTNTPPPMPMFRMAAGQAADASTSVSPGELRVRVDVTATYELER